MQPWKDCWHVAAPDESTVPAQPLSWQLKGVPQLGCEELDVVEEVELKEATDALTVVGAALVVEVGIAVIEVDVTNVVEGDWGGLAVSPRSAASTFWASIAPGNTPSAINVSTCVDELELEEEVEDLFVVVEPGLSGSSGGGNIGGNIIYSGSKPQMNQLHPKGQMMIG